ncbi:hypothetical protein JCM15519_29420 [Fundidesulfovibrio butyratiphilus]
MPDRPTALYVSPGYPAALESSGFRVHTVSPPPGLFDLPAYLEQTGLSPDLVLQDEILAPRVLIKGLWTFDRPVVYWSRDPHLNHSWQAPYVSQFDLVASTQKDWLAPFQALGVSRTLWLPWCESPHAFRPHVARSHPVGFVGRVSVHRPKRRLFAEFLARSFDARVETDLPPAEVRDFYAQTRLAPDESLHGEITHRLFAAAAAGCLPVVPRADNGLEELFTPGSEVLLYEGALELAEVLTWGLAHPEAVQSMGEAARLRLEAAHQPRNRMETLGQAARTLGRTGPRGPAGEKLFWLGAARCLEANLLPGCESAVSAELVRRRDDPDACCALLALLVRAGKRDQALGMAASAFEAGFAPAYGPFLLALAALALDRGQAALVLRAVARLVALRLVDRAPSDAGPAGTCLAMAQAWLRLGVERRPGFPFEPGLTLPASALECLMLAHHLAPADIVVKRRLADTLGRMPGMEVPHLGLVCELSLANQQDFRQSLAVGLAEIAAFRPEQGLKELLQARRNALGQGRLASFDRALAGRDPSGRVRRALARAREEKREEASGGQRG